MWISYFKIAFRILVRNWRFTLINLAGLTLGLAGFVIIFSWVRNEMSFDRFHKNKDRIMQLVLKHPDGTMDPNVPYAMARQMSTQFPEIESSSLFIRMESRMECAFEFNLDSSETTKAYIPHVVAVDTTFFRIFGFTMKHGKKGSLLHQPNDVVISTGIADVYFPNINPVGQSIKLNNNTLLTVTGVVEIPENTFFRYDFFIPVFDDMSNDWNWRDPAYILLQPPTDPVAFGNKIEDYMNEVYPNPLPGKFQLTIVPIQKIHLLFEGKAKILLFSMVALFLILVASLNYINLATANYSERIHESGIRKVLGATRRELMIHMFAESILIVVGAMLLALFLAELILPAMTPLFGTRIEIGYLDHPAILAIMLALTLFLGGTASIYPSLLMARGNPVEVLHRAFQPVSRRSFIILFTIILQFTLSIGLMISTLIVIKQVRYSAGAPLGFSVRNVIAIPLNQGIGNHFRDFLARLEQHPDIEMATAGQSFPFNEDFKTNIDWSLKEDPALGLCRYSICMNSYPALFDMEVIQGRNYSQGFRADSDKFLINEQAAAMLGFDDPIGETLTMWGLTGEIIGVVKDFHHISLHREILPHVFNVHPSNYRNLRYIFIKVRSGKNPETISYIESICRELAPAYPFSYTVLEEEVRSLYSNDLNLSRVLGLFALLALCISSLGIYGLAFYSSDRYHKSITIRKIFGASMGTLLSIFYRNMLSRIGISLLLAIFLTIVIMGRWLQNFAYRINPDPLLYAVPAILALSIAGMATWIAIRRIILLNPADSLKQE
jgi:ABC-type antimicrobial peptide transport system permease subunit